MKLQIAFDSTDLQKSVEIALAVAEYADMIEIGSILIHKYGVKAVETFRDNLPKKHLIADIKIIERGKDVTSLILNSGADWVTVMAGTSKEVIHSVCNEAHNLNKKVMLDLMDSCAPGQSALEAKSLGVDALLFHQIYDDSQQLLLDKWDIVRSNTNLAIFVTSKFTRTNIEKTNEIKPDGVIVGRSITQAQDPISEAKFFYEFCNAKRS